MVSDCYLIELQYYNITSAKEYPSKIIFKILFSQSLKKAMSSLKFDVDYFPVTGGTEKIQQNNSVIFSAVFKAKARGSK